MANIDLSALVEELRKAPAKDKALILEALQPTVELECTKNIRVTLKGTILTFEVDLSKGGDKTMTTKDGVRYGTHRYNPVKYLNHGRASKFYCNFDKDGNVQFVDSAKDALVGGELPTVWTYDDRMAELGVK